MTIANEFTSTSAIRTKQIHKAKIAKELASQRTETHLTSQYTICGLTDQEEGRTYNKGIAASRAGRCYLRLQFAISLGFGRTSIVGLLVVIFYFYNFIHQRLGSDTAMNSLPAAIPNR